MKFSKLTLNFNIDNNYEKELFFDLLFSISNKVKTHTDFISKRNEEIDFNYNSLLKKFDKYKNNKKPLEYIFKKVNFCNKNFYIEEGVFIPRKETEYMISYFIKQYKDFNFNLILDLCSGSGIISCIFKIAFPNSKVIGIEKSRKAINISKKNMQLHKLKIDFFNDDFLFATHIFDKKIDFVFFNPPYISRDFELDDSLLYEPKRALFARNNGLFYYEKFFSKFFHLFSKNTLFLVEFGYNQKQDLTNILEKNNIINWEFTRDIFGKDRFLLINFKMKGNNNGCF